MRADLTEVLDLVLRRAVTELRVGLPGRVTKVEGARVNVQVGVRPPVADPATDPEALPELLGVPVLVPSTTAAALALALAPGDPGMVWFADAHLGSWLAGVDDAAPAIDDPHGLSGAVFRPGLWPDGDGPGAPAGAATLEARGGEALEVLAGEVRAGRGAVEAAVLGTTQDAALRALLMTFTATFTAINALPAHAGVAAPGITGITAYLAGSYLGTVTKVK